jgi:hypothetical protein
MVVIVIVETDRTGRAMTVSRLCSPTRWFGCADGKRREKAEQH